MNNTRMSLMPPYKEKSEIEEAYDYVCDAIRILENNNPPNLWDIRIFLNKASFKLEKIL